MCSRLEQELRLGQFGGSGHLQTDDDEADGCGCDGFGGTLLLLLSTSTAVERCWQH